MNIKDPLTFLAQEGKLIIVKYNSMSENKDPLSWAREEISVLS